MRTLLVLGASPSLVPLIRAAKSIPDVSVAVASIPGDYPGFAHADKVVHADISNPEDVLSAVRDLSLDGVATCGIDFCMESLGALCEERRLPGPTRAIARRASNKYLMKETFLNEAVPTPSCLRITKEEDLQKLPEAFTFPLIVKAVDQCGSRGITRCDTQEALYQGFAAAMRASKLDYCIVEPFFKGTMFGAEGMLQNGQMLFTMIDSTVNFAGTGVPTPIGHDIPSGFPEDTEQEARRAVAHAAKALHLDNCPFNADLMLSEGNVYVIEMAARAGATGLAELVGTRFGINYYEVIARLALGEQVTDFFSRKSNTAVSSRTLYSPLGGTVRSVKHPAPRSGKIRLLHEEINIAAGDIVPAYRNGRDGIGRIIMCGKDDGTGFVRQAADEFIADAMPELETDLPLSATRIEEVETDANGNQIFIKRDDTLPFSYGGNKVRFANAYLRDMEQQGKTALITYGNLHSNLCRILGEACAKRNIPWAMIHNTDDADPDLRDCNARLILESGVRNYPCTKDTIAKTVQRALEDFTNEGYLPYYTHGDIYGRGNVHTPMAACAALYREITRQEAEMHFHFDKIFLASSTQTTQAGLLAQQLIDGDAARAIIGIAVSRKQVRGMEVLRDNLVEYQQKFACTYRLPVEEHLYLRDQYLSGGYGKTSFAIEKTIDRMDARGILLDPVYTAKAYYGMIQTLQEEQISGKRILFLHTGGIPLYLSYREEHPC